MAANYPFIRLEFDKRRAGNQGNVQMTALELTLAGAPIAYDVPRARSTLGARFPVGVQSAQYLRFTVEETVAPNAGRVQINEFVLISGGSAVSWPVGTVATNPGGNNQDAASGAIDGDTSGTKWGDGLINTNGFAVLHIDTQTGVTFDAFEFWTGNDSEGADPGQWLFEISDDDVSWDTIHDHPYFAGLPATGDEWPLALLDGNDGTKWNASNYVGEVLDFEWRQAAAIGFDGWRYKTGNDDPNRDPVSARLWGSLTGLDESWVLLSTIVDEDITEDRDTYTSIFPVSAPGGGSAIPAIVHHRKQQGAQ